MNKPLLLIPLAFLAGGALVAAIRPGQEPGAQEMTPEQQMELMMKVMQAGMPGEQHAHFAAAVGEYDIATKWRMDPNSDWEEAPASSKVSTTLGGRYMVEKFKGDFGGMPFEGLLFLGYDNTKQEYVAVWMDSMSTRPMISYGTTDDKGVMTLTGKVYDPISPEGRDTRMVHIPMDTGQMMMKMYDTIPPHGEVQVMEMVYTRKGGDHAADASHAGDGGAAHGGSGHDGDRR